MTHAEKRLIMSTAAEVRVLRERVDALCAAVEMLTERKKGRPTRVEAQRLEEMQARANG